MQKVIEGWIAYETVSHFAGVLEVEVGHILRKAICRADDPNNRAVRVTIGVEYVEEEGGS